MRSAAHARMSAKAEFANRRPGRPGDASANVPMSTARSPVAAADSSLWPSAKAEMRSHAANAMFQAMKRILDSFHEPWCGPTDGRRVWLVRRAVCGLERDEDRASAPPSHDPKEAFARDNCVADLPTSIQKAGADHSGQRTAAPSAGRANRCFALSSGGLERRAAPLARRRAP